MSAAHKENAKLVRNLYETCTKLVTETSETAKLVAFQENKIDPLIFISGDPARFAVSLVFL